MLFFPPQIIDVDYFKLAVHIYNYHALRDDHMIGIVLLINSIILFRQSICPRQSIGPTVHWSDSPLVRQI